MAISLQSAKLKNRENVVEISMVGTPGQELGMTFLDHEVNYI
jgi:hypothetical protein